MRIQELLNDEDLYELWLLVTDGIWDCWRRLKIDHLEGFVPIEF